ncbi:MAG: magnesium transporter CorA family protein [Arenimonas sp.]
MPIRSCLYRADAIDLEVALDDKVLAGLNERQLLWVDIVDPQDNELERIATLFDVPLAALRVPSQPRRPSLENYGGCFRLVVYAALDGQNGDCQAHPLTLVAGENFVVSVHGDLPFIEELRHREKGDTKLGELTDESFVASLLDRQLSTFFHAVERLEHTVDEGEVAVLGRDPPSGFLRRMVRARQVISELRRLLKPHRDVFYGLARPDFTATERPEAKPHFTALIAHFERAEDALESARDLVVGSFDLFATRASQRTNESMRVLTFATVLMGLLSLIAGVLGMNFGLPLFDSGTSGFFTVLGGMATIAVVALLVGRWRRWY